MLKLKAINVKINYLVVVGRVGQKDKICLNAERIIRNVHNISIKKCKPVFQSSTICESLKFKTSNNGLWMKNVNEAKFKGKAGEFYLNQIGIIFYEELDFVNKKCNLELKFYQRFIRMLLEKHRDREQKNDDIEE
jgi:hypothetical protein